MNKISKIYDMILTMSHEEIEVFLGGFGEIIDTNKWKLVSSEPVDYESEDIDVPELNFASVGTSQPHRKSAQDGFDNDGVRYRIRYSYNPNKVSSNSRDFCRLMIQKGKVFRKEDILKMSKKPVNPGFGPHGVDTYSIWLHKGGVNCHHRWYREIYIEQTDETITTTKSRSKGLKTPKNDPLVATAPIDTPTKGRLK